MYALASPIAMASPSALPGVSVVCRCHVCALSASRLSATRPR